MSLGSSPKKSPTKKSGASSSAMEKASNRPWTRTVDAAAAKTTTKGKTRVDQALDVEASKVINNLNLKIQEI